MPPRKPAGEKYESVQLRLHPRDAARLRELADSLGCSLGATVTRLLDERELQRRGSAA